MKQRRREGRKEKRRKRRGRGIETREKEEKDRKVGRWREGIKGRRSAWSSGTELSFSCAPPGLDLDSGHTDSQAGWLKGRTESYPIFPES